MVAPIIIAAGIAAGGALAGGALSQSSADKAAAQDAAAQREFAQHGVRWRVADAKAAGLHPLYSLGANVPTFSPVARAGQSAFGRGVSEASAHIASGVRARGRTAQNAQLTALQLRQAEAQTKIAELDYVMMSAEWSQLQRGHGNINSMQDRIENEIIAAEDQITVIPKEITSRRSSDKSLTPGSEPGWRLVDVGGGLSFYAPQSDEGWAEGLEGITPQLATLVKNVTALMGKTYHWGLENLATLKKHPIYQRVKERLKKANIKYPAHRTSSGRIRPAN